MELRVIGYKPWDWILHLQALRDWVQFCGYCSGYLGFMKIENFLYLLAFWALSIIHRRHSPVSETVFGG
jgi:hypothetical protein